MRLPGSVRDATPRILVTDGQDRSGLAGLRSLRAAGYAVDVVAYGGFAAAQWSRYCGQRFQVADPRQEDGTPFVDGLRTLAERSNYAAIVTASDASLLAISRNRERLEPFVELGLPEPPVVERCVNKARLVEAATAVGLGSPETEVCADPAEAVEAARRFGFPVVLKSQKSVFPGDGDRMLQPGGASVDDEASLRILLPEYGTPCLVQRQEPGPVVSFSGVATANGLLACGMSRYARTWPPGAGMASFAETITPMSDLRARIERLLAEIEWEGVFELELIRRKDASFAAIDFNPRLFGSLELITAAGAPLAAVWCDSMLGRSPEKAEARPGYRYRWEEGELRYFWQQLRRARLRRVLAVLRPRRRTVKSLFRFTDPAPLVARLLFLLNYRFRGDG
jgi:predicted ATP-grasp superfamily ATP-dependent carboligase